MARSQSIFLTAIVSMVLGVAIGVVGLLALAGTITKDANEAVHEQEGEPVSAPQVYGSR